jgi:hypothetical protein
MEYFEKPFFRTLLAILLSIQHVDACSASSKAEAAAIARPTCYGRVVDGNGTPVIGLTVFLQVKAGTMVPMQTVTDADGHFSFDNVAPQVYQLSFSSQTIIFADCASRLFNCRQKEIDMRANTDLQEVSVALDSSAAMLEGEIVDQSGSLLTGLAYLVIRRGDDYYSAAIIAVHDHFKVLIPSSTDLAVTLFSGDSYRVWTYRDSINQFATIRLDQGSTKHLRIMLEAPVKP